jgi:hypothetical protein
MATNVTEKDKTLHEVIDFLQKEWDAANNASDNPDEEVYDFYDGMTTAYEHVINYCRHLLGYSARCLPRCRIKARMRKNEMETGLVGHRRKPADRTDGGGCGRNIHCLLRLHMGRSDNRQNHHHARRKSIIRLHGQRHKPGPT